MKKIKPSFYAQAFWELTKEKTLAEKKAITDKFLQLLQKNKQLRLWPRVIRAYEKLLREKKEVILATVITEKEMTATELAKITSFLQKTEQVQEVGLIIKKEDLGLGLVVETTEKRWNLTLDKQITDFRKQLIS